MSKEREQHPCLSKDQLELGWPWHKEERSKPKTKIDNNYDVCRLKQAVRKLKTIDGLTLSLCEECFRKNVQPSITKVPAPSSSARR